MSKIEEGLEKAVNYKPDLIDFKNLESLPPSMFLPIHNGDKEQYNLRYFLEVLMRRKWIVAIFLLTVVTIVAVVTFSQTPIYKSISTIQIQNVESHIMPFEHDKPENPKKEYYPTQYNILKSTNLAERVIEKLNLDTVLSPQKNLIDAWVHSLKTYISAFFTKYFEKEPSEMRIGPSVLDNEIKSLYGIDIEEYNQKIKAINKFKENLEIQPIANSQLVNISYLSPDPVLAANVANTIADEYTKFMMDIKLNPTLEAKTRFQKEADTMRTKLSDSEKALNKYLEKSQIIFLNESNSENRSLFTMKLSELSSEMDRAVADRISKEAIYREVTKSGVQYAVVLDNPLIQSLTLEYAKREAEYFNLLKIHKPAYPKMRQLKKQIESIKSKIEQEEQKILKSFISDYKIAVKREAYLSSVIKSLRKDVASFQQKMVRYHILRREVETNRDLYKLLLKRLKEVYISTALAESNVQIIDKAKIAQVPFKPRKALNMVLSLFIGLLGGVFLAFLVENFDRSVKNVDDIERGARIPVIGAVPVLKVDSQKLIGENSDHHCLFTEALRSFSTFVQFSNGQKPPKKILITSPLPGDGKTLLATHIAKNYLNFSGKGIIVDADMRRQRAHEILNVDNVTGLSSYLSGNVTLQNAIKKFPHPQFDAMTAGPTPPNPAALLNSSRMKELIGFLSNTYDFVIVDSPPLIGISDSLILSRLVDTVVMIVRASTTPRDALVQATQLLNGVNANILGVVLNGINVSSRYGYARYYSSYYETDKTK
jgi:capsular exopolysaccharide synthesis family protein